MRDKTRITVVTPVFNGEDYIRETINSVLNHSRGFPVEYLVIDDGSTDSTPKILREFGSSIKVITQPNGGESKAVNMGIRNSVGDFLLIVSADDPLFTSEIFLGVVEFFENNPSVVAWYPNWQMINENGSVIKVVQVSGYSDEKLIGRYLCLPGPGTFIRKSAALSIGGRHEKWRFVGDYDFWLRISRIGRLEKRDALVAQWRMHEGSTSISKRGPEMFTERIEVMEEFISANQIHGRLKRMAQSHAYYHAAALAFFSKEVNGKRALLKAFWARKWLIEDAQLHVIGYLLLLPISAIFAPVIKKYLKRLR